ncbi:MAG: hypothetical protein E5Y31_25965 [Mesorhizobium sp.]|nr:MAG: hypothetical protein E5Y31_25965 [Mesorhizobium sp.]
MIKKTAVRQNEGEARAALKTATTAMDEAGRRLLASVRNHGTKPDKRGREWEKIRREEYIAAHTLHEAAYETLSLLNRPENRVS